MTRFKQVLLLPLVFILRVLGVHDRHFFALLQAKLKMDFRRPPNSFQSGGKKQTLVKQLLIYCVLGVVMIISLYHITDFKLQLSIFFSILIVFVGTILLTEFTSVLFDETENHILLPRPISSRTLLMVRLVHIFTYVFVIALGLSLPYMVYVGFNYGLVVLSFGLAVVLCASFTLVSSVGFYMLLSRFVSAERFKDVLNYFQIGLAIIIMGGYQLVPQMIDDTTAENLIFKADLWTYFMPSVWFAGLTQTLGGNGNSADVYLSIIAVVSVIAGGVILVRTLSKGFNSIVAEAATGTAQKKEKSSARSKGFKNRIKALLCVSETEEAGWDLTMSHVKSDRKLKQQIYPPLAYSLIMAIVFLKPDFQNLSQFYIELADSAKFVMFIVTGFFGTTAISIISYTETPKAAWIYDMASTKQKYHIQSGSVKALLYSFYLPLHVFYLIPIVWIWGYQVLPLVILGAALTAVLVILLVSIQSMPLPFSKAKEMINKGEQTLKMFLGLLLVGVIVGLVYLLSLIHPSVAIVLCLFMPLALSLSYRVIRNTK